MFTILLFSIGFPKGPIDPQGGSFFILYFSVIPFELFLSDAEVKFILE